MNLSREKPAADYETVRVDLPARGYDILVGQGLLAETGRHVGAVARGRRCAVVTNEVVAPLYLDAVRASLEDAGLTTEEIVLPQGEHTKDLRHLGDLADRLLEFRIDRACILVALGGGVVGDIAGFAASIVLRGIDYVQIPTTLLAQVDSAVGGKTAVNTRHGKNLLGAFHQPRLVLADIATLETLSTREFLAGYAEVVKYGLLGDADFFSWLEREGAALYEGDHAARRHAVVTCCAAKAAIVAGDEREAGRRQLLNLGHTFAHAFEAETAYGTTLLHGEAVAIGMVLAFELSVRLGFCPSDDAERVRRHFAERGLRVGLEGLADASWTADSLLEHMAHDKKALGGALTFVLARGIGEAFTSSAVEIGTVRTLLEDALRV
ncbi:MAG: 3-dehydroquinate synthase [Rhodospirillales bacterium]|nr:3-dehydroquinate synthase [Rhodospirillales bacterium]